jgi:hypothetical protein
MGSWSAGAERFLVGFAGHDLRPTEAGDVYTYPMNPDGLRDGHGSPFAVCRNDGPLMQHSEAIPLEWFPELLGGDQDHPVVYRELRLGKRITPSHNGWPNVVQWQSIVTVPHLLQSALGLDGVDIPAAYLNGNFRRYLSYDAVSDTVHDQVLVPGCSDIGVVFAPLYGGAIVSTDDGSAAMGIYGVSTTAGGSVSDFHVTSYVTCEPSGTGPNNFNTSRLAVLWHGDLHPGTATFNVWVITDTLANVHARMRDLYLLGVR